MVLCGRARFASNARSLCALSPFSLLSSAPSSILLFLHPARAFGARAGGARLGFGARLGLDARRRRRAAPATAALLLPACRRRFLALHARRRGRAAAAAAALFLRRRGRAAVAAAAALGLAAPRRGLLPLARQCKAKHEAVPARADAQRGAQRRLVLAGRRRRRLEAAHYVEPVERGRAAARPDEEGFRVVHVEQARALTAAAEVGGRRPLEVAVAFAFQRVDAPELGKVGAAVRFQAALDRRVVGVLDIEKGSFGAGWRARKRRCARRPRACERRPRSAAPPAARAHTAPPPPLSPTLIER